jgi:radical SAM superfamily enzyme YgiQ (UPF0313 family)
MISSKKYRVMLGDLRHSTIGRQNAAMPLGIACIASYLLSLNNCDNIEIRLYDDADIFIKDIDQWNPSLIGLSNYCWNAELSRLVFNYAKNSDPNIVCVAGGPELPVDHEKCLKYLQQRNMVDFYVYREGEIAFSKLVQKLMDGQELAYLKEIPQVGMMSVHPKTMELITGKPVPRIMNLDVIPSPYLTGLLDEWFDGYYVPSIQTSYGCPFSCRYCSMSHKWYNKIATYSTERIKTELKYIAQRMIKYPTVMLSIVDSNWGILERDEEISRYIRILMDEYGWPERISVTTAKTDMKRILRMNSHVKQSFRIDGAIQSLNPETVKFLKRNNLSLDKYKEIQLKIRKRGMGSNVELIVPLPNETKSSFFESVKKLFDTGVETLIPYTTMLLKGTYLDSLECREKYEMVTKFRLLPRQFGTYKESKCFEIEEVCVATSTMSFEDYLDCRGFAWISSLLFTEQFDLIRLHLKEFKINFFVYLSEFWELVKSGQTELSAIYNDYIEETKNELFDSFEAINKYYKNQENYDRLLAGTVGDNLVRKYKTKMFLECCIPSIELAYFVLEKNITNDNKQKVSQALDAAKQWMISTRNFSAIYEQKAYRNRIDTLNLQYDVNSWYTNNIESKPLISYKKQVKYKVSCNANHLEMIFQEGERLYGKDRVFQTGKLLIEWSMRDFWRKCEPVTAG